MRGNKPTAGAVARPIDTTPNAADVQMRIQQGLSGLERLRLAIDMSDLARDLLRARFRREHPDWNQAQIVRAIAQLRGTESDFRAR